MPLANEQKNVPGSWSFAKMLNKFSKFKGDFEKLSERQQLGLGFGFKRTTSTYYRLKDEIIDKWMERLGFDSIESNPKVINSILLFSS